MTREERLQQAAAAKRYAGHEDLVCRLEKGAEIAESIASDVGGLAGAATGGIAGLTIPTILMSDLGFDSKKWGGKAGKYKLLAALLAGGVGTVAGGKLGSAMGRGAMSADARREQEGMLTAAAANRTKALLDAQAMEAYRRAGLMNT